MAENIDYILTDEEKEIARRARNLSIPIARRQIQAEYRQATAFEALIGWLYFYNKTRLQFVLGELEKFLIF